MSEELEKLRRALDRATDAGDVEEEELDDETASLREAWLNFGRLIEAAQPAEDVLVEYPVDVSPNRSWRRVWALAGTLAAALLLGGAVFWTLAVHQRTEPTPAASPNALADASKLEQKSVLATSANDATQWDDDLDDRIAQIEWGMYAARHGSYSETAAGDMVQYRIEQMRQYVENTEF